MSDKRRLPVFRTVARACLESAKNFGYFSHVAWLGLAVAITAYAAACAIIVHTFGRPNPKALEYNYLAREAAYAIFVVPVLAAIAVAWHRFMVQGQRADRPASLYLEADVRRYAVVALVFMAWTVATLFGAYHLLHFQQTWIKPPSMLSSLSPFVILAFLFLSLLAACRLSLWLPAVALGRREATAAWAWNAARGNTWRMFAGCMLCWIPTIALNGLISAAGKPDDPDLWAVREAVRDVLTGVVFTLPTLSFLSLAYMRLVQGRD